MGSNRNYDFIVIDDSKLDCFIAEKVIKNTGASDSIKSFVDAKVALEYIKSSTSEAMRPVVILVDIQMPVMNGFQFVEAFEALGIGFTAHYTIFIISSSIHEQDLKRVNKYASVRQFLNKPLNSNVLGALLNQL